MTKQNALPYVSFAVDDALSERSLSEIPADLERVRFVGWQCGCEPLFVAVWSYLGVPLEDSDAEGLAQELLQARGWYSGPVRDADYIL